MFRPNKKLTQSVTFTTEDAADQALWEVIEKELSLTKYQTFSNLCKQALWQFLFVSESPATPPSLSSMPAMPVSSQKFEEQITQLQKQLSRLEHQMLASEETRFEQLQRQLTQMTQQLAQLQIAVTLQPSSPTPEALVTQTPQPPSIQPVAEPVQPEEKPTSQQESDPVLQRLSSLIDDF